MIRHSFFFLLLFATTSVFGQAMRSDTLDWFFAVDEYRLSDAALSAGASEILARIDPKIKHELIIIAATDCSGSTSHNRHLAERRSKTVADWLTKNHPEFSRSSILYPEENCRTGQEGLNPPSRRVSLVIRREMPVDQVVETVIEIVDDEPIVEPPSSMQDLETATVGTVIVMEGFQFIGGRHIPLPESMPKLEELYRVMRENDSLSIEIAGHICCMGGEPGDGLDWDTGLENLSQARANFVRDYLISRGVDGKRMIARGYGSRVPLIFPELNESDAQKNRRVEIKITQQ
jgi:outer membrane protein OmpA-like peptidoglycan-associated protein